MAADGDPRYRLVYEEALRALDGQWTQRDDLRSRAAAVLAAASIATAFLGGQALGRGDTLRLSAWIAVGAFALIVGLGTYVLAPRRSTHFTSAERLLSQYVEAPEPTGIDSMHRNLALHVERDYLANMESLARLTLAVQASCIALLVELAAWLLDLRGR